MAMHDTAQHEHAFENFTYHESPNPNSYSLRIYYRLLIVQLVSMAIICLLVIINIMLTISSAHQIRENRYDTMMILRDHQSSQQNANENYHRIHEAIDRRIENIEKKLNIQKHIPTPG